MAMGTERSSKPLHNFSMPCLKWGNQRFLRCMKVNSNGDVVGAVDRRSSAPVVAAAAAAADSAACDVDRSLVIGNRRHRESEFGRRGSNCFSRIGGGDSFKLSPSRSPEIRWKLKQERDGDDGIEAMRTKLMFDLQTAADKMKDAILKEGLEEEEEDEQQRAPTLVLPASAEVPADAESEAVRPWNLRTRRAACKAPNGGIIVGGGGAGGSNGKSLKLDVLKPSFLPTRSEIKSPRLRGEAAAASPSGEKRERAKFSVSLSRREIEEDFMSMLGQRPSRRPKKRPKVVQKQLDTLFPGLWLSEVNADLYKVPEATETGKR